jgi:hypothetical protein
MAKQKKERPTPPKPDTFKWGKQGVTRFKCAFCTFDAPDEQTVYDHMESRHLDQYAGGKTTATTNKQ